MLDVLVAVLAAPAIKPTTVALQPAPGVLIPTNMTLNELNATGMNISGVTALPWWWSSPSTCSLSCSGGAYGGWGSGRTCSCTSGCSRGPYSNGATVTINGCGASSGVSFNGVLPQVAINCCNVHDMCYGRPRANQLSCDRAMRDCMCNVGYCSTGYSAYGLLLAGGWRAFDATQQRVISCS